MSEVSSEELQSNTSKKKDEKDDTESQPTTTTGSIKQTAQCDRRPEQQEKPKQSSIKRVVTVLHQREELVASTPNQRNWRGILIALLVIVAVLGLIVFSIVLLSPPDEGPRVKGRKFTLEDVLGSRFAAPRFNGTWVSDVELVYKDPQGGVSVFNAENLTSRVLMTNSTFRQLNAVDFLISSDLNFILLISDVKKLFRYSFEALYHVYEVDTRNNYALSPLDDERDAKPLQYVVWSPKGSALAFVYQNDVYYRAHPRRGSTIKITNSGRPGIVFNGVPDWLYEEEILRTPGALWFSPDCRYLLYGSFNDTLVGELRYPWYGTLQQRLQYPKLRTLRYPKAGTPNPVAALWTADLSNPKHLVLNDLKPPLDVKASQDHYFTAVTWFANSEVGVIWMNRRQNISIISVCQGPVWNCEETHLDKANAWSELDEAPLFSADGSSYVARLPVLDGDKGHFRHVVQVDVATRRATPLTHGPFEVTHISAWDEENHIVYFVAAPEGLPGQRHLFHVGDVNGTLKGWDCLTCPLPDLPTGHPDLIIASSGNESELEQPCLFVRPHFSLGESPKYYVLECLGPEPPFHILVDALSGTRKAVLNNHDALRERLAMMAMPQIKTFKVEVANGYHAQVRFQFPPGLREYEDMMFPLILHVSGAPGSQLVSQKWSMDWATYLAGQRNFIVAQVDGRGSGFQGDKMRHELFLRLGSVEIEDQIAVLQYLRDNLKFIDKDRIGVWGWSYGGFASAMILAQDKEVFRCGISVAPVTSWAHYDSAYSERYMGTPNVTDNYRGYEEADVTKRAGNLRDKMFLLIHGTADNTVHYQQSMMLVRALTEEGVLFRHQTYPDEGHTFSGVQSHFYKEMESFFDDCFGPLDFEEWEFGTNFFSFKQ